MNDDIIKQIAEEYITALCASLPATEAYSYTFSPQFEKKMKRLIFKTNHPYRFVLSRAASVAIVFLLLFSSVLAVDVKAREAFIGWLEECHITFSRFFFAGEVEAQEELHFDLGWVPEGYVAQERIKIPGGESVLYTNTDGFILDFTYSTAPENTELYLFPQSAIEQTASVNATPAKLFIAQSTDETSSIVWQDSMQGTLYAISCRCGSSELIRIAENIVKK